MRLLLIEDDAETAAFVVEGLSLRGHACETVMDGQAGLVTAMAGGFDVMIIDRMLPSLDGLSVARVLRDAGRETPILILTALGSVEDRVAGLEGGADDYLVKPFSMPELVARVDALGRRGTSASPTRLAIADLTLDRLTRQVRRDGELVDLQHREFQLLEALMLQTPNVVTRTMLLEGVWKIRFDPGTSLVESHVSRLRAKIDRAGSPMLIHTVRGEGYAARTP